jgi:broad specificity phosphatase PhoE
VIGEPGETSFIYEGAFLRVRWMRYRGAFPARDVLLAFPDDFTRFLQRVQEMGDTGRILLRHHGHYLKAPYQELHQFNMERTRSWGFRTGNVYVVLCAAKKRTSGQEQDYDRALRMRADYLERMPDD